MEQIIPISAMETLVNRDYKTIWRWVKRGVFPQPVRVSGRAIGWTENSYKKWLSDSLAVRGKA